MAGDEQRVQGSKGGKTLEVLYKFDVPYMGCIICQGVGVIDISDKHRFQYLVCSCRRLIKVVTKNEN